MTDPVSKFLHKIDEVKLGPTEASTTIAGATDVFKWIDPDLKKWGLDKLSIKNAHSVLDINEMKKSGTFNQLYGSIGNIHDQVLTQGQVVEFCRDNSDKLQQGGWGTFFLIQRDDGELSVADVLVDDSGLEVLVFQFEDDFVWHGEGTRRLVIPQLETQI